MYVVGMFLNRIYNNNEIELFSFFFTIFNFALIFFRGILILKIFNKRNHEEFCFEKIYIYLNSFSTLDKHSFPLKC